MRNAIVLASALGAASLFGLSLTGCDGAGDGSGGGGSGGGGGGSGGGPSVGEACARLSSAVCGQIDGCSPFLMQVTYGDAATCEARLAARCDDPTELEASNLTAADIDACAAEYEARTCDDLYAGAPSACRVPGDKDAGATCATAAECKSNTCLTPAEGSCGECVTPLAEGATCAAATDVCGTGLYCNSATMKCEKPAASGETCGAEKLCASGLSCNDGKCGALQGNGASCANGETCDLAAGVICFALDGTCRKVSVAKLGESCGYDDATGEISTCEADARCGDDFTCAARPKEGDACTIDPDSQQSDCASGFDCVGGTCAAGLPQCE